MSLVFYRYEFDSADSICDTRISEYSQTDTTALNGYVN